MARLKVRSHSPPQDTPLGETWDSSYVQPKRLNETQYSSNMSLAHIVIVLGPKSSSYQIYLFLRPPSNLFNITFPINNRVRDL